MSKQYTLTVKSLSRRSYMAIHNLPRGYRSDALRGVLSAVADLDERDPTWFEAAITRNLSVRRTHGNSGR